MPPDIKITQPGVLAVGERILTCDELRVVEESYARSPMGAGRVKKRLGVSDPNHELFSTELANFVRELIREYGNP